MYQQHVGETGDESVKSYSSTNIPTPNQASQNGLGISVSTLRRSVRGVPIIFYGDI